MTTISIPFVYGIHGDLPPLNNDGFVCSSVMGFAHVQQNTKKIQQATMKQCILLYVQTATTT